MSECKGCKPPKRYPGCQSHCPVGIKEAEEAEKRRETLRAAKAVEVEKNSYLMSSDHRKRWRKK